MPVPNLMPNATDKTVRKSGEKAGVPYFDKWTARHQMVASLHVAGYNHGEIAAAMKLDPAYVSIILSDPRARVAVEELVSGVADRVTDVRARLELYSNEVLSGIMDVFRDTKSEDIKQKVGFGLLDRAGYKPHTGEDSRKGEEPGVLTEEVVSRLTEALEESDSIGVIYKTSGPQDVTDLTAEGREDAA